MGPPATNCLNIMFDLEKAIATWRSAAERRTREIAIRKAVGASVSSVVAMLSKDFAKLVVLAAVISTPISWMVMQRWLEEFPFRTEMSPWMPAVAALGALIIALLTVSYHALRAAKSDPVKSLNCE